MAKTKEEREAYQKEWALRNRDKVLGYKKKWNHANKPRKNAWLRAEHAKNPEKYRAKVRRWRQRNPEKVRDNLRACSARRRAPGQITAAMARQIRIEEPNCKYCGRPSKHLDHITPICHGGTNDRANLQMLCASCNSRKALGERKQTPRRDA